MNYFETAKAINCGRKPGFSKDGVTMMTTILNEEKSPKKDV